MLIYYDKIFKDTAEHKINYSTPNVMALLKESNKGISPISLIHIANNGSEAILRIQTTNIFSKESNNL